MKMKMIAENLNRFKKENVWIKFFQMKDEYTVINDSEPIFIQKVDIMFGEQIVLNNDPEYYIFIDYKESKIKYRDDNRELNDVYIFEYMSLKDYYTMEFNSIMNDNNLDWIERVEIVGDLNKEINEIKMKCKTKRCLYF